MIESMRVRGILVVSFLVFIAMYLLPNFVELPKGWWFYQKKLNYGLDIQGGAHLVYGVDVPGVLAERTERMARSLQTELKSKGTEIEAVVSSNKDSITLKTKSEADRAKVDALLKEQYATTLQTLSETGNDIQVRYYDSVLETYRTQVVNQAIEVIRNRVDQFGVAEPIIAAQGTDRILVQLPGISDPARAKELINKTAKLEFRLVDTTSNSAKLTEIVTKAEQDGKFAIGKDGLTYVAYVKKLNEILKPQLPANTMIAFQKAPQATSMEVGKIPILLRTDSDVSGDQLEDAYMSAGEYGEPKVSFRFNSVGAKQFGQLTEKNIGRQLAIVLDEVIYSAPVIQSRIDREGQISLGGRNVEEAQKEGSIIATTLRAGALPATLTQLEERSVGPSLGMDSIQKGKRAGVIGFLLVVVFVIFYYRMTGLVAAICLGMNVAGLLAILSALGATLTLPGIAGITLTMGMAVDANVIIFERIKEELARGVSMKSAVHDGFAHAWSAIFDSNITTAIAAAVLIYFGTGPVRGFGVTLIAGIITTMITAVFVTRYLLNLLMGRSNKNISIGA
jgi:preprotein translocase subunit SecD